MRRELSEKEILDTVRDIRHEAPGIGAYKLYLMLKELYPDEMRGRDWFYGLMHESHLMLKPGKRRHTTSSNHPYRKYKNMIKGLTVNRINQLWVADITYIDTDEGVAYLHLLTDAFTHEIIGWVLSDSLVASNTVTALDMGISHVSPLGFDGLIHHSDRGVQYCCNQYIDRLQAIKATTSMTTIMMPPRIWATLPTMSFAFLERKMQMASTPPMMTPAFSGMPIMALKPSDTPPTLPILNARPPSTTSTTRRYPRPGRTLLAIS